MKLSDRTSIEHLEHGRFEAREAQRDAWDEKRESDRDLEYESRLAEEQEHSDDERNQ